MNFKAKEGLMFMSSTGRIIKFKSGLYSTNNKDDIALLKNCKEVSEIVSEQKAKESKS